MTDDTAAPMTREQLRRFTGLPIPTFSNGGHAETVTDVALIRPTFNFDPFLNQTLHEGFRDPLPPDFIPRMQRAVRDAARQMERVIRDLSRAIGRIGTRLSDAANDPVHVAGLEATYAVRAGLHRITFDDRFYLHDLVRVIMRGGGHPDAPTSLLTRENRAQVAAAALRGYVVGHPETVTAPVTSVVWTYGARHPSTVTRAWPVPR